MESIPCKTIVTRSKSSGWFGAEYNMNIYRGCCHGCIYCDSRSDCYRVENFDTVKPKANALSVIRDDLRRKVRSGVVATGSMSDPYNPLEEQLQLTRHALELLAAYGFGVAIATKSPLVARDIDVLKEIAVQCPVVVKITITAADDELCRRVEPGVAPTSKRVEALAALAQAGIPCGLLLMPVLPFLTDSEENILAIVAQAKQHGARFIYPGMGVTLRDSQRQHFYRMLDERFPGLKEQYIRRYGNQYSCGAPQVKRLYSVFTAACNEAGLLYKMPDIISCYKMGYADSQLSFFD